MIFRLCRCVPHYGLVPSRWGDCGYGVCVSRIKTKARGGGKALVWSPQALYFRASGSGVAMPWPSSRFHSDARMDTGASLLDRTGSVVLEGVACPMGCPRGDEAVLTGHDRLHGLPGRFTVVRCNTCKLKRTTHRPDAAEKNGRASGRERERQ